MRKKRLIGIAQDVELACEMGLTYGALKAPPVYVRGYAGPTYPKICAALGKDSEEPAKKKTAPRRCLSCGGPLSGRQGKFCCRECSWDWQRQQRAGVSNCIVCGKALKGRQQKYCSASCRDNYSSIKYRERRAKAPEVRLCPNCGKPVTGSGTYCDAVCGNQYRQKQYYDRKKGHAAVPGQTPENG